MDTKKSNKIIAISFLGLAIIIAVLVVFNMNSLSDNKEKLSLYVDGQEMAVYEKKDLLEIDGIEDVLLTQNKNGKPSVDRNLTVLDLKDFLEFTGIDIENISSIKVTALDGFSASYTKDEVLTDNSIYIMLYENGEDLPIEDGNFSMAVPSDSDSTRWIRQIYKIEVIC